jgi:hypothetical protein
MPTMLPEDVKSVRVNVSDAAGELRFSRAPGPGESPISPELAAVLSAAYRPLPAVVDPVVNPVVNSVVESPTEPADPPPPALTHRRPAGEPRGDGLRCTAAGTHSDLQIEGFCQNITVDYAGSARLTLNNVRSVRAWRGAPADLYEGQGLYIGRSGTVSLRGCLFGWNGWQPDRPWPARNRYRHGVYQDVQGGFLDVEDSLFLYNAACSVQIRNGARFRRCLFVGNPIHLLAVRGDVILEDCVFYGGGRYVELNEQNQPRSFQGNAGVLAYTSVSMTNVLIAGWPGQHDPNGEIAGLRSWNIGAVNAARGHDRNPDGFGRVQASRCTIAGWPGDSGGKLFTGDPGFGGEGFAARPGPVDVRVKLDALFAAVVTNRLSVVSAASQGLAIVRQAVG